MNKAIVVATSMTAGAELVLEVLKSMLTTRTTGSTNKIRMMYSDLEAREKVVSTPE